MGKLIMNGIPYSSGDVEANPSGTATDTLTKLGIEGTVYEIQGGGGSTGGKAYTEVTLWSNTSGQRFGGSSNYTATLTDDLSNYDSVCIVTAPHNNADYVTPTIIPVDVIKNYSHVNNIMTGGSTYMIPIFNYDDETHLTFSAWSSSSDYDLILYEVKGLIYGGNLSPIIYSTEEREVGVWTDGKPLYQKTYRNVTITNNGDNIVDANLSGITLVSYDLEWSGLTNNKSDFQNQVIDTLYLDNRGLVYYFVRSGTWWHGCDTADITVQYTKDSDTAGSGQYTTLGVPTVHYDGNEKVIGTWFGETLYEKTFTGLATNTNGDNWVNISGIDATTWKDAVNVEIYSNSSDVNNKLTRIALGEARVFNGNVQVTTSVAYNREINVATIQYTKTS